ncbi:MAG TPA: PrsW family intramembrane metalloprotease, partial [Rhodothermales bacterium]|nr:PrsW family intramembrane metalloprotease [Rhodothermales bacterium]
LAGFANEMGGSFLLGLEGMKALAIAMGATDDAAMAITAVFVAPVVEESLKGAALLALVLRRRDEFDGPVDGIVYGALVGLGFAMTENALYYVEAFVAGGAGGATGLFLIRGLFAGFGHPLYTSMTGIGLGLALAGKRGPRRIILPVVGLLTGITLHFLWNLSATAAENTNGGSIVAVYFGLMLPALIAWLIFATRARRREGRLIAEHLAADVAAGLLAADLHAELGTLRGRTAAVRAALKQGGVTAMKARRAFHRAASDEGLRRWRAAVAEEESVIRHDYLIHLAGLTTTAPRAAGPSPAAPPTPPPPAPRPPAP